MDDARGKAWAKFSLRLARLAAGLLLLALGAATVSYQWCARGYGELFDNSLDAQAPLQKGVELWLERKPGVDDYKTSSQLYSGEWLFGTYFMAGMGFGQMARLHPELKDRNLKLLAACVDRLLTKELRAYDAKSWGADPLDALDSESGSGAHLAYLGYLNLLLSLESSLNPDSPHAALNAKITRFLVKRYEISKSMLLETYPGETYPVDNCAAIGSIGLYGKAAGASPANSGLLLRWSANCRARYVDANTGLLFQAVSSLDGSPLDAPRGSGTALGLYLLSFADPALSKDLYSALKRELASSCLSFGAVREYPRGYAGRGDIDSGPIVFGYGFSSTGFSMAGSRLFGDKPYFKRLYATSIFAGAPYEKDGAKLFVTGGPLGEAILFAMFTAHLEGGRTE